VDPFPPPPGRHRLATGRHPFFPAAPTKRRIGSAPHLRLGPVRHVVAPAPPPSVRGRPLSLLFLAANRASAGPARRRRASTGRGRSSIMWRSLPPPFPAPRPPRQGRRQPPWDRCGR